MSTASDAASAMTEAAPSSTIDSAFSPAPTASSPIRSTRGRTAWMPAGGRASPTTSPAVTASASSSTDRRYRAHLVGSGTATVPTMADQAFEALRYEVHGPVARLTIDREERRNALSWPLIAELRRALALAKADEDVRVVVLTGAGEVAFCAGADLDGMAGGGSFTDLHEGRGQLADLFRDLYALGKPTIARAQGYALAGGFGLALACDLLVAADDAVFGTPEITLGLWPHMITVPLVR